MNGRVIGCLIVACVVFGLRPAAADVVPDPGLPADLKTAQDISSPGSQQISDAIKAEFAKLADDTNPDNQTAARDWLVNEATLKDNPSSTSSYYISAYAGALNNAALQQLSKPDTTDRCRLNIAVAVTRILLAAGNKELSPTVLALLKDKTPSVVIWGQRAAGNLLDFLLAGNNAADPDRQAVFDAVAAAVVANPEPPLGGLIADEAYRAIRPEGRHLANLSDAALKMVVEANVKLQDSRLKLYLAGVPEWPDADTSASGFLLSGAVWESMNPDNRKAAMQQASNLIALAGHRAAQRAGNLDPVTVELILVLRHEGVYVQILAQRTLNADQLRSAAGSVAALSPTTPAANITAAVDKIFPAIRDSDTMFSDLQPPPELPGMTAVSR
jgi:hypothetical protein